MPPKKRKTGRSGSKSASTSATPAQPHFMWLLEYKSTGQYGEPDDTKASLYSTKEKAIKAFPMLMSVKSPWGDDWKNGMEGFGAEDKDDYLGFECFAKNVRASNGGGVLLSNENQDGDNETVKISVERMQVDPPDQQVTAHDTDDEVEYIGLAY